MMSRNLLLVAVTGALAGWLPVAGAQQKHVVLSNVDGVSGQAQVGGKAAIPLMGNAQVDPLGNIVVTCQTGTHGTGCSNIGSGSAGTISAPGITFNGPAATVPAGDTSARLHWTTTNAHACYGITAPTGVTGWTKEWAASTTSSTGFLVGNLPRHASNPTNYNFTLRCYSSSAGTSGSTPIVGYTDSTRVVTLAPSAGTTSGNCASYLDSLSPEDRAHYDAYSAEAREFTKTEMTFQAKTSRILGQQFGVINPTLPGLLGNTQYLSLSFSLPAAGEINTGKFSLSTQAGQGFAHPVVITISPCQGDFRPRNTASGAEHYTSTYCRTIYDQAGTTVRGAVPGAASGDWCNIPVGQTMYMNISKHNMYTAPGNPIPPANCGAATQCGVGSQIAN